ncbi:mini-chromosome maintenance complex-binding protein isoform X2 [Henckelia pumila]|uniref:mini-chromosome maintenance complex-binding protein isoform X2 n=1 Tax=Henckelia pumila TaxID=405737 RepID=UPI003C6E8F25
MVGMPHDCLANPLGAVRLTFEKAVASGYDPAVLQGKDWGTAELFRQFLFDDDCLSQVPMLSPSTLKWVQPNTLVRFRGMIQDMLGNEFYVGAYKDGDTWRTNKFADSSHSPINTSLDMQIWERRLLYCIPVPGQNFWVESLEEAVKNTHTNLISPKREKRPREDEAILGDVDMMREDGLSSEPLTTMPQTVTGGTFSNVSSVPDTEINYFSCRIKIYDTAESEMKLNDIFEFVGVLTFDPEFPVDSVDCDGFTQSICEDELVHLPSSKVSWIHCIIHRKLAVNDFLSGPALELMPNTAKDLREALVGHLTTVLGNDWVAAQYMLLHLLSRVHARVDSVAVGKLSLNLTCLGKDSMSVFGRNLKFAIECLLPFTRTLPITINYLNTISLTPKKDYNTNRLVFGFLQLTEGSHLTIDETQLQAGTLDSTGVDNARVLKNLMESQTVEYDFTYYKMEMPVDVQLLILSEGKSHILPADLVLPFRPSSVEAPLTVDEETLKAWRWYLGMMKCLSHSIDPDVQKVVEDDLVAARRADRSLGSLDFSRLLTMGRLMSISFGESHLSKEHWQMVKELETIRKERLQEI